MNKPQFSIGDSVRNNIWGDAGDIVKVYETFHCIKFVSMSPSEWLEIQTLPVRPTDLKTHWYEIEYWGGGHGFCPESYIEAHSIMEEIFST